MNRSRRHPHPAFAVFAAATLLLATAANAQQSVDAARQRYDREIARCNDGTFAAPARDACVRDAGLALDRARGGPPVEVPVTTPDGRSTVVTPAGAPRPADASDTTISKDGRATIVLPAGRTP